MRNFLTARWENLIMANYAIDPSILLPYLPAGTELDSFKGVTYVSLVGFMFKGTRIFGIPAYPFQNFEEINLRFYVTRKENDEIKRGVVFINETVPHRSVAWIANKLYKEKYSAIPTKHSWEQIKDVLNITYAWKNKTTWNDMRVAANAVAQEIKKDSLEEFIFEHYYGYTKVSAFATSEYKVEHPRWQVYDVIDSIINCDFESMYGKPFRSLNNELPASVMLAGGSPIAVKWKRSRLAAPLVAPSIKDIIPDSPV